MAGLRWRLSFGTSAPRFGGIAYRPADALRSSVAPLPLDYGQHRPPASRVLGILPPHLPHRHEAYQPPLPAHSLTHSRSYRQSRAEELQPSYRQSSGPTTHQARQAIAFTASASDLPLAFQSAH